MPKKRAKSEYATAGVDYTKIEPFKMAMVRAILIRLCDWHHRTSK